MNNYKIKDEFFILLAAVLRGTTGTSQAIIGTDLIKGCRTLKVR